MHDAALQILATCDKCHREDTVLLELPGGMMFLCARCWLFGGARPDVRVLDQGDAMSRPHDPSLCDVMVMEFVESDVGLRGTAVMMGSAVAPESQSEFPESDTERDMQTHHGYATTKPPASGSRGRR